MLWVSASFLVPAVDSWKGGEGRWTPIWLRKTSGAGSVPKNRLVEFTVTICRKEVCCFTALGGWRGCSVYTYGNKVPAMRNLRFSQDLIWQARCPNEVSHVWMGSWEGREVVNCLSKSIQWSWRIGSCGFADFLHASQKKWAFRRNLCKARRAYRLVGMAFRGE